MTTSLRKGDKGLEVRHLQDLLNKANLHMKVKADGEFGSKTDIAVRIFQRRMGLLPDGIAGPRTIQALKTVTAGSPLLLKELTNPTHSFYRKLLFELMDRIGGFIYHPAASAQAHPHAIGVSSSSLVSGMHISEDGSQFIFIHESGYGSNRLHWPRGASGVTLGAGYDMKERDSAAIVQDMMAIGLSDSVAKKIGEAAGLKGNGAEAFVKANRELVDLTKQQEMGLLKKIIQSYELVVKSGISVNLMQYEFDALVCFAYNPGGRFNTVARLINHGKVADAMKEMQKAITSGGHVMQGLKNRRHDEVNLYLYGDYGRLH